MDEHASLHGLQIGPGRVLDLVDVPSQGDAVVEGLGGQQPGRRREARILELAPADRILVGGVPAGVGIAGHNDLHDVADVVPAGDQLVGEMIEQFGMAGRIVVAKVVHRLHEPAADERGPETVDEVAGEKAVAGVGEPVGEAAPQFAGNRRHHHRLAAARGRRVIFDGVDQQVVDDLVFRRRPLPADVVDRRGERLVVGRCDRQRPGRLEGR